jgi:DNA-binding transcriptional regulator YiaG
MKKDKEFVKNVRFKLKMRVTEFALKLEVEPKYVYRWEHEGVIPSGTMIFKILRLCKEQGINLDDLVFLLKSVICGMYI